MTRLAGKKIAVFRDENQVWGRVVADIPAFGGELGAALVHSEM